MSIETKEINRVSFSKRALNSAANINLQNVVRISRTGKGSVSDSRTFDSFAKSRLLDTAFSNIEKMLAKKGLVE